VACALDLEQPGRCRVVEPLELEGCRRYGEPTRRSWPELLWLASLGWMALLLQAAAHGLENPGGG
jgi:hypothetical protein